MQNNELKLKQSSALQTIDDCGRALTLRAEKLRSTLVRQLHVMDINLNAAQEQATLEHIYKGLKLELHVRNRGPHRPQKSNSGETDYDQCWDLVELDLREFADDAFLLHTEFFTEYSLATMMIPDQVLSRIKTRRDAEAFRVFGVLVELDLETDAMIVQVKRSERIPFGNPDMNIEFLEFDGPLEGKRCMLAGLGINYYCEDGFRIRDLQRFSFYTSCMEDFVTEDIVQ